MNVPVHKLLRPFPGTIRPYPATCGHHSHRLLHLGAAGTIWMHSWEGRHHGRRQDRQRRLTLRFLCRRHLQIYILSPETRRIYLRPCGRTTSLTSYFLKVQVCLFSRSSHPRKHTKTWTQTSCNSNKCIIKGSSSKGSRKMCRPCMANTNSNKDNTVSQMANIIVLCNSIRPPSRQALPAFLDPPAGSNRQAKRRPATHGLLSFKGFRKAKVQTRGAREVLVGPRCRAR